jgi:5-methylcytosine-specific restriction endonuclease McrA
VDELRCPACGETEDLVGRQNDEMIEVTCERCNQQWERDPNAIPACDRCGGDDMEGAVKAVVEKSRGSQLSIVATQVVYLCRVCDERILASYRVGRSPLMPDQLPTE